MSEFEIRAAKTHVRMHGKTLIGLAAPYDKPTEIQTPNGSFTEIISSGAFRSVLAANPDCVCTVNHDESLVLGRTSNGTLKLGEDHRGLNFAVELPDSDYAKHVHENVKRGDLAGCSFAFTVGPKDQTWGESHSGKLTRHITNFSGLHDVSVVTRPAYPGTAVDARAGQPQVTVETRAMVEHFTMRRLINESVAKRTTEHFVRDQLGVDMTKRSLEDQLKLMQMAVDLESMRAQGWNVEVRMERDWPTIVHAGPTLEERRAASVKVRRLIDFILE